MSDATPSHSALLANIGPRERRKRLIAGWVALAAAGILAYGLFGFHWARPWRLGLFPFVWIGAMGVLQAREKT